MSGFKYSTTDLKKEREEAISVLSQVREARAKGKALQKGIRETLDRTPRGIKDMFKDETARARGWLETSMRSEQDNVDSADYYPQYEWRDGYLATELALAMYGNLDNLKKALESLTALVEQGMSIQRALLIALNQKADAAEQALVLRLAQFEAQYEGNRELLDAWYPREVARELESALKAVAYNLAKFRIQEGSVRLEAAENRLAACLREARELEHKHQKRLYILKCLRQVCREMGFEETEPRYLGERPDRTQTIVYQVDTIDQGTIVFYLSLDRINTRAAIAEDQCLGEFAEISHSLESEFGIKTRFGPEEEKPDERLLHKGELDLPEGAHIARSL